MNIQNEVSGILKQNMRDKCTLNLLTVEHHYKMTSKIYTRDCISVYKHLHKEHLHEVLKNYL